MPQQVVPRFEISSVNCRCLRHLKDTNLGIAAAQSPWPQSGNSQQLSCSSTPMMKHLTLMYGATFPCPWTCSTNEQHRNNPWRRILAQLCLSILQQWCEAYVAGPLEVISQHPDKWWQCFPPLQSAFAELVALLSKFVISYRLGLKPCLRCLHNLNNTCFTPTHFHFYLYLSFFFFDLFEENWKFMPPIRSWFSTFLNIKNIINFKVRVVWGP